MPEPGNMARPKLTGVGDWAHSKLAGSNVSPAVNGLGIQGVEKISGKSNTKNLLDRIAKEFSPRAPGDSGNSGSSGAGLTDAQKEHMRKYPILEPGSWEWRESSGFSWDSLMDGAELVKEHLEDVESAAKGNEMATAEMQGELNAFAAEQGPKGELQMYAKQHLAKGEERIQAVLSRFAEEHHRIAAMIQELGRITMDGNALQAAHGKWDLRQDERLRLLHAHMEEFQAPDALQGFSLQPFLRRAAQVSADVDAIMSGVGEPIETGVDAHKAFLHKEAVRLRALIFAPHGLLDQAREELEDSSKAAFDALDAKLAAAHEGIGGSLSTVVAVAGQVESGLAVMSRAVLGQLQGLEDAEAALQGHISAAVGVLRGAVEENTAELAALQGFLAVIAQRQVHNLAPCQAASLTTRALEGVLDLLYQRNATLAGEEIVAPAFAAQREKALDWEVKLYEDEEELKWEQRRHDHAAAHNVSAWETAAIDERQGEAAGERWRAQLKQFLDERALILSLYHQGLALDLDSKVDTSDARHEGKSVWEVLLLSLIDHLDASIHHAEHELGAWGSRVANDTSAAHAESARVERSTAALGKLAEEIAALRGEVASGAVAKRLGASFDGELRAAALQRALLVEEIAGMRRLLLASQLAVPASCKRPVNVVGVPEGPAPENFVPKVLIGDPAAVEAWKKVVEAFTSHQGTPGGDLGRGLNATTHPWGLGWGENGADLAVAVGAEGQQQLSAAGREAGRVAARPSTAAAKQPARDESQNGERGPTGGRGRAA